MSIELDETRLGLLSFIPDAKAEMEKIKKEQAGMVDLSQIPNLENQISEQPSEVSGQQEIPEDNKQEMI